MAQTDGSRWTITDLFDGDEPLGGSFSPVGISIYTFGMKKLLVWVRVDFQSSTEVEMCVHAKKTKGAIVTFPIPHLYSNANGKVDVTQLCYRIKDNTYEDIPIPIDISDLAPFVQLYFRASGGPPVAKLLNVQYSMRA